MSHVKRIFPVLLALAAIGGLAACGSSDDSGTTGGTITENPRPAKETTARDSKPAVPTIVVKNGKPVGGVQELEYSAGDQVRFDVRSDVADEVHVHGYDLMKDVPAGGEVSFSFPAEIEGIFEVELEDRAEQIAELRVNP